MSSTVFINSKVMVTPDGGLSIKMTNKTGAASVKGTIVEADTTTARAFKVAVASSVVPLGIVFEDGVADGSECWVVVSGIAFVLLKDTTASTLGYWAKTSDVAGRANVTVSAPPGDATNWQQVGYCLETQGAGTDVLARCVLHFN